MMTKAINFLRCAIGIIILAGFYPIAMTITAVFTALVVESFKEWVEFMSFEHEAFKGVICELWRHGTSKA